MVDHWQDNSIVTAEIKDDDEAPEDWEAELEEKPQKQTVAENPKESVKPVTTAKAKTTKKQSHDNQDCQIIIKERDDNYTPEELDQIEKRQELQQEQDKLNMVAELVENNGDHYSLDNTSLVTREEFMNYSFHLHNRLQTLSKSEFYPEFIDHFLNGITQSMSIEGVKHLQATLQAIYLRKQSDEREKKAKSKTKKQTKPQLKTGRRTDYADIASGNPDYDGQIDYDDDDDFM